ncbi:MAG: hypothetical protein A2Y25_05600 [Candidatus Melainabacteria bacterium GWF2_37_15]|nr:MAG: hypothetical protein A2Y25_05600 [Candidatus Melainabacteria bacterium GWF2_37_15]
MRKFPVKIFILFFFITSLTFNVYAADFNVRITREEFADFYGVLIIEEEYKDLPMDDIFSSSFDPITGKLKKDEIFSVRSPYFDPDIFKRQKKEKLQITEENTEEQEFKNVYNVKLSTKPVVQKNSFKEKLLAANNLIKVGKPADLSELEKEAGNNPVNISNIAKLYIKTGNEQKALELLQQAKELAPDDYKILYTYGVTLYKNGQIDLAESNLVKITQVKPDFMYAHYNLGNIYYKKKEYKNALDSFKKAMELAPDNADIYFNLAIALEMLGHKDLAIKFYSKCLELKPDDNEAYKSLQRLKHL